VKKYSFIGLLLISILAPVSVYADDSVAASAVPEIASENSVPALLSGIWQGSDRLVRFADTDGGFYCVLRTFYAWYDDRAAESAAYTATFSRDKNDTESDHPEVISVEYKTIAENDAKTAGAYELAVQYPKQKNTVSIPVAVINGKLYLSFMIAETKDNEMNGYWRAAGTASGITVSVPREAKEVVSYYFTEGGVYHIRYWLSEMEYTDEKATFTDGEQKYTVDKYIRAGGCVYSCTTGRSTEIRNIEKSSSFVSAHVLDDEKMICAIGKEYLVKVPGAQTNEQLQTLVAENNKRKYPAPKPLFPPADINFHWKEISELEKYNPWTWNRRNIDLGK
jgi:hypothetical protein